ncbi:hypothetical protein [Lacibacter sediminis]|uniref:DUF4595 domain-containing protein n=1 Tax=Lacibacter sediminis TaxID=2760713 RepID=A0A7G5XIG4_9BACT|nr:hypothetical protein [Lacibacter sediminis]QNA45267.1 hypothetical protein H4075_03430 [Lacibacter sediminis]
MKKIFFIVAIVAFASSCKKDKTAPEAAVLFNKNLVSMTSPGQGEWNMFYTNNHRLLSFSAGTRTINYKPGVPFSAKKTEAGLANVEYKNSVQDANGRVIKLDYYNGAVLSGKYEFTYDEQGYLVKAVKTAANPYKVAAYVYAYNGGNLVSITASNNGVVEGSFVFDYYPDLINPLHIDLFEFKSIDIVTDDHFGRQSKNLVKQVKLLSKDGQTFFSTDLSYTLDEAGYLKTITATAVGQAPTVYSCNFQ